MANNTWEWIQEATAKHFPMLSLRAWRGAKGCDDWKVGFVFDGAEWGNTFEEACERFAGRLRQMIEEKENTDDTNG